ncbi:HD domain-containing protein [Paenibacillus sp. y28]|uniref:HD domain-containing protein n=1 Tax=Paenibacillus sp. y28 TaxID=3129110 RepID=UPI00301A4568
MKTLHMDRLVQQIQFIVEVDKLKSIQRQSMVTDRTRQENDAEHSWHLALMAMMLAEHANEPDLNVMRVIQMVLIHDLVEIDAGDTFAYDDKGQEDKAEREQLAAERLFGLLPDYQRALFFELWNEFEARNTPEARYAAALDRLQPMLLNYHTDGAAWRKHGVTSDRVFKRNAHIAEGSEALWRYAEQMIHDAVEKGFLQK